MGTTMDPKTSLTVAARSSGVPLRFEHVGGSAATNARRVPYSELYRQRSGLYETPIQRIQRAAEDEAAREAQSDQYGVQASPSGETLPSWSVMYPPSTRRWAFVESSQAMNIWNVCPAAGGADGRDGRAV